MAPRSQRVSVTDFALKLIRSRLGLGFFLPFADPAGKIDLVNAANEGSESRMKETVDRDAVIWEFR